MGLGGLVELTQDLSPDTLERLAAGAYRSSRSGTVGLALNGVTAEAVDRKLDPVVRSERSGVSGVWYLDGSAPNARLLDLAAGARFVIAISPALRAALDEQGIRWLDLAEGLALLSRGGASGSPRRGRRAPSGRPAHRGTLATS